MKFLETRSEVKVTVTELWYRTLRHPNMHPHTKFEIPTSNNMRYAPHKIILKTRSEVKVMVTVTRKWYVKLRHPKMYAHTKFGIPKRYAPDSMQFLETRSGVKFKVTVTNYETGHFVIQRCIHTPNLRFLPQII